jgi:hypothetical protein
MGIDARKAKCDACGAVNPRPTQGGYLLRSEQLDWKRSPSLPSNGLPSLSPPITGATFVMKENCVRLCAVTIIDELLLTRVDARTKLPNIGKHTLGLDIKMRESRDMISRLRTVSFTLLTRSFKANILELWVDTTIL